MTSCDFTLVDRSGALTAVISRDDHSVLARHWVLKALAPPTSGPAVKLGASRDKRPSILSQAAAIASQHGSSSIRKQANVLLASLESALGQLSASDLPELDCRTMEDGSLILEWRFTDRRLAFTLEEEPRESAWHFVTKSPSSVQALGEMPPADLERLLAWVLHRDPRRI